jgi:hypothetical protein
MKRSPSDIFYYLTVSFGLTVIAMWVVLMILKVFVFFCK